MKSIDQLQRLQFPLIIEQRRNDFENDDDSEDITSLKLRSSLSLSFYQMAIFISCLMTFLISLFIISLSLVWILSDNQQPTTTMITIGGNERDSFLPQFQFFSFNDTPSSSNLILNSNDGQHQVLASGDSHIISINFSRRSFLDDIYNDNHLSNFLSERHSNKLDKIKLRRNSSLHLLSSNPKKLNEILSENYPENRLLNLNNFKFILKNFKHCQNFLTKKTKHNLNLVIVIHSAIEHFRHRQLIRQTWGRIRSVRSSYPESQQQAKIAYVFILGATDSPVVQRRIQKEFEKYGDLVQGNFRDTYYNLTYKHLLSLRWSVESCPQAEFILKLDDDAYLNLFAVIKSLFNFISLQFNNQDLPKRNLLACSLFPPGTKPKRHGKWSLSYEMYPYETFPRYCSGVGYLITPDLAFDLFEAAHNAPELPLIPIDDVYVTGLLVKTLEQQFEPINSMYVYDVRILRNWLKNPDDIVCPNNFWIGDIGSEPNWQALAWKLWNKTKRAWENYQHTKRCKF